MHEIKFKIKLFFQKDVHYFHNGNNEALIQRNSFVEKFIHFNYFFFTQLKLCALKLSNLKIQPFRMAHLIIWKKYYKN